jgi:gliding motility-associated-like protein
MYIEKKYCILQHHMKYYFLLLTLIMQLSSFAQLETKNWFIFENRIAVTPSGVTTGLQLPASNVFPVGSKSASVSDAGGNLLFAFNGNTIIDRNLNIMPALTNSNIAAAADKMMIQQIPNTSKYYVFYLNRTGLPNLVNSYCTIKYALVDLSLNSGNGDVLTYNQVVDTLCSPSFTLVQGSDPSKAWLVTHRWATDSFHVFPIIGAGINLTPVKSKAGTVATLQDYIFHDLKTSYDGSMFAGLAYRDYTNNFALTYGFAEVFNFNAVTGAVTAKVRTRRLSNYFYHYFSLEFSADNRLLYDSRAVRIYGLQPCGFGASNLRQYNLCYSDSLDFENYSTTVASEFFFCAPNATWGNIQMGADKRIHMPFTGFNVPTVNFPNRIGTSSNYVFNSYSLPNQNFGYVGVPDFHHKLMEKAIKNNIVYSGGCHPNPINLKITNDTITNIQWNFGDPASVNNTSTLANPSHVFSGPGNYTVTAKIYNSINVLIETVTELVEIKDPSKRLLDGWPADTTMCAGAKINIHVNVVNGIFYWFQKDAMGNIINGSVSDSMLIDYTGKWYVQMRQNDCNGCIRLDSINVTVLPKPDFSLGPDRNLCTGDSIVLSIFDPAATFLWSTGAIGNSITITQPGLYWLQAEYNSNGCPVRDSIVITQVPGVVFSLPADTTLCNNQSLLLNPGITNATYLWQNGTILPQFTVTQPGEYWAKVTSQNGCSYSDTINVAYVSAQQVNLGNDSSLCIGSSITLNAGVSNMQYQWSTGATSQIITVSQTGLYWVRVNNGSCVVTDTINLAFNTPPVVYLGKDTTICANKTLLLNPGIANAQYIWSSGSQASTYLVTQPGKYWVQIKSGGCTVSDTIDVAQYPVPAVNLGPDTRFCTGDSLLLMAPPGFLNYNWDNNSNASLTTVRQPGQYWVTCTTIEGCVTSDTMQVLSLYPLPKVSLGNDASICKGSSKLLSAGSGFTNYRWSTGATVPSIAVSVTGIYSVAVTDAFGCKGSDTLAIISMLPLPSAFLPADTFICSYGTIVLKTTTPYNNYFWNTGAITQALTITQPGSYWLEVSDNNLCTGRDSINVFTKDCMLGVYFPTAFTPNNDGKNDEFKPLVFGIVEKYSFRVFNRYGELVYFADVPGNGWNGKMRGMPQGYGGFTWICTYKLRNQPERTEKGSVLLIR